VKPDEIKNAVKRLGGLFPGQLTTEHGRQLFGELSGFSAAAVNDAIGEHARTRDRFGYAQFLEGCRAAERGQSAAHTNTDREGTWFDVQRRLCPQLSRASDVEVALRVYRKHLMASPATESYRAKYRRECGVQLVTAGMTVDASERWAETIFADPDHFRLVLDDLRDSQQANPFVAASTVNV
jgi:hypothetical protein